jgi:hypothetical protein
VTVKVLNKVLLGTVSKGIWRVGEVPQQWLSPLDDSDIPRERVLCFLNNGKVLHSRLRSVA